MSVADLPRGFDDAYELSKKQLGKGAFGSVFVAKKKSNGQSVAVKVLPKGTTNLEASLQLELDVLKRVQGSKYLLQSLDAFQDRKNFYLVTELLTEGELFRQLEKKNWIYSEKDACIVLTSVLKGIKELHSKNILHRDLKLENILCCEGFEKDQSRIKIIDFGCSIVLGKSEYAEGAIGSEMYAAPEVFCGVPYSFPSDMWSFAVLSWLLLAGEPPFHPDDGPLPPQILACKLRFPSEVWKDMDKAQLLMTQLLTPKPENRPTASDCLKHSFFRQAAQAEPWEPVLSPRRPNLALYNSSSGNPTGGSSARKSAGDYLTPRESTIKFSKPIVLEKTPVLTKRVRQQVSQRTLKVIPPGGSPPVIPPIKIGTTILHHSDSTASLSPVKAWEEEAKLINEEERLFLAHLSEARVTEYMQNKRMFLQEQQKIFGVKK